MKTPSVIADGFEVCNLHIQSSPPVGQFTNVSIMGLLAYVEDDAVIAALSKFGEIKSEVIRLKCKTGHDLAGLQNGNRLFKVILATASIPYSVKIEGEWCRIIHSNQKPVCNICLEEGHRRLHVPKYPALNVAKPAISDQTAQTTHKTTITTMPSTTP